MRLWRRSKIEEGEDVNLTTLPAFLKAVGVTLQVGLIAICTSLGVALVNNVNLANMTVTPERKEAVEFTNPNLKVAVQALVPDNSPVQKLDDLADKTIIVTTGTTADVWLTKNHPDWKLLRFEKNSESLQALANGRGDAYAQDNLVLFSWAKQNPGYRTLPEKLGGEAPIAPAVKKGNIELRDWVNTELARLGQDKYLLKLYDQYVRKELAADTKPEDVIVEGGNWQG